MTVSVPPRLESALTGRPPKTGPRGRLRRGIKRAVYSLLLRLPSTPFFDRMHALPQFYVAHRRLPRQDTRLFNDYLYFLKTRPDRDGSLELRRQVTDKLGAKKYASQVLGREISPRTLCVFDDPKEVTEDAIPFQCVIKPTHLGGGTVVFHRGGRLSPQTLETIRGWFGVDLYRDIQRNPNYRGLRPRVLCEEMIAESGAMKDYKFFCYKGAPRVIIVDVGRHTSHRRALYTTNWDRLPYWYSKPHAESEERPEMLEEMLDAAVSLSAPFEFIRVDLYQTPGRIWFGEFANYPASGNARFESREAERHFSEIMFGAARLDHRFRPGHELSTPASAISGKGHDLSN